MDEYGTEVLLAVHVVEDERVEPAVGLVHEGSVPFVVGFAVFMHDNHGSVGLCLSNTITICILHHQDAKRLHTVCTVLDELDVASVAAYVHPDLIPDLTSCLYRTCATDSTSDLVPLPLLSTASSWPGS